MILNILMHYNKKIECFTQPIFTDIEPEKVAIQESRSIQVCHEIEKIKPYENLKLYYIGVFDDSTGEFTLFDENGDELKRELLDCTKIVKARINELRPKEGASA